MKELLKKLIEAESTLKKGELASAQVLKAEFDRIGIESKVDVWDQTRANVWAVVNGSGQRKGLFFGCHLDVVPPGKVKWQNPPFTAVELNGKIFGRGAADMKGGIAAVVAAIGQIVASGAKLNGDIIFAATAGEETDSCGTEKFVKDFAAKDQKLQGVVVPEPTDFEVITAHRGLIWLEITTKGKTAHGSMPHLGVNAIGSMKMVLNELDNFKIDFTPHKLLGGCSMSVNTITGGKAFNVVPDQCTLGIDIRTLPGQDYERIVDDLEKICSKLKQKDPKFDANVAIARRAEAMETDPDHEFVKEFCGITNVSETKAAGFTTDGPHFSAFGAPIVIYGPGKPDVCHKPDEYIDTADLDKAVKIYKNIILKFLG